MVENGMGRKLLMPRNLPASEPQENEDREDPNENASGSESQGIQVEGQT